MARKKLKEMRHKDQKKIKEPGKREEEKKEKETINLQQPIEAMEKEAQGKPEENIEFAKQDHYLKKILIAMMLVMVVIAGVAWFRYQAMRFEYAGLNFEKIMFDKLQLYHAKIPLSSVVTGNVVANFNLYLRNDPRELESIPITGRIRLKRNAIVALDPSMEDCSDNAIAGLNLGQFLGAAGIKPLEGSTNLSEALEKEVKYASCENVVSSVIITEKSDTTQITKEGEDCYKIQVAICDDVVKATERFIIGAIGHSSGYDI